jgi:hypothetical protein
MLFEGLSEIPPLIHPLKKNVNNNNEKKTKTKHKSINLRIKSNTYKLKKFKY